MLTQQAAPLVQHAPPSQQSAVFWLWAALRAPTRPKTATAAVRMSFFIG